MSQNEACVAPVVEGMAPARRGKVRELYDLGDRLLLIASDRISAFDCVLASGIPGKGRILTQLSRFWFDTLSSASPHHLISSEPADMPAAVRPSVEALDGRAMLCDKLDIVPFECIVRGYLAGSGWKQYQAERRVQEYPLPAGLELGSQLPEPLFTPTTKAETGHDMPITTAEMFAEIGDELGAALRDRSLALFSEAQDHCRARGLILCDTKFEFGIRTDAEGRRELVLADEVLTPDSSRFFKASEHAPGRKVTPWDKQLVRDYLNGIEWSQASPPVLPEEIVAETARRYHEIHRLLTGPAV